MMKAIAKVVKEQSEAAQQKGIEESEIQNAATVAMLHLVSHISLLRIADEQNREFAEVVKNVGERLFLGIVDAVADTVQRELDRPDEFKASQWPATLKGTA